jgi:hypothetical protein
MDASVVSASREYCEGGERRLNESGPAPRRALDLTHCGTKSWPERAELTKTCPGEQRPEHILDGTEAERVIAMAARGYAYRQSERATGESEVRLLVNVAVRVRLLVNAVIERLAFFAPRHGAFALTGTAGFCLFERARLAPLIHAGSTRTRSRLVFRGWGVRASRDQGDAGNSGPIHAQASNGDCALCPPAQCAGSNFTMNVTGRHATCSTWNSFAAMCCRYKKRADGAQHCQCPRPPGTEENRVECHASPSTKGENVIITSDRVTPNPETAIPCCRPLSLAFAG